MPAVSTTRSGCRAQRLRRSGVVFDGSGMCASSPAEADRAYVAESGGLGTMEVCGRAKHGAAYGAGLSPAVAVRSDTGEVLHSRMRSGSSSADHEHFVREAGPQPVTVRSSPMGESAPTAIDHDPPEAAAVEAIDDGVGADACGGEAHRRGRPPRRQACLIVPAACSAPNASCGPTGATTASSPKRPRHRRRRRLHRAHATVELAIRDLKESAGLSRCPSGRFFANGAWLALRARAQPRPLDRRHPPRPPAHRWAPHNPGPPRQATTNFNCTQQPQPAPDLSSRQRPAQRRHTPRAQPPTHRPHTRRRTHTPARRPPSPKPSTATSRWTGLEAARVGDHPPVVGLFRVDRVPQQRTRWRFLSSRAGPGGDGCDGRCCRLVVMIIRWAVTILGSGPGVL